MENQQGTQQFASINFKNTLPVELARVELIHQTGDSGYDKQTWRDVKPGEIAKPRLQVIYWTGYSAPWFDYWDFTITMMDGVKFSVKNKECQLKAADDVSQGEHIFEIMNGYYLNINLRSGAALGALSYPIGGKSKFNSFAFIQIVNNMTVNGSPMGAIPTLTHACKTNTCSDRKDYVSNFKRVPACGGISKIWNVYFVSFGYASTIDELICKIELDDGTELTTKRFIWNGLNTAACGATLQFTIDAEGLKTGSEYNEWTEDI